jgi:N-acetylmuramoyl-L-alanine amidase
MTRTEDTTVSLVQRTNLAELEDADIFISVHNNAFPDGVNPWENNGTSVYYTHPRGAGLAWATQRELLAELGLRDIGVGRADLHVTRYTWSPSILTETMFMMIPEQEAALRDPGVQRRIAEAHVRGLVRWLAEVAR